VQVHLSIVGSELKKLVRIPSASTPTGVYILPNLADGIGKLFRYPFMVGSRFEHNAVILAKIICNVLYRILFTNELLNFANERKPSTC
jgi:hypothetical protein